MSGFLEIALAHATRDEWVVVPEGDTNHKNPGWILGHGWEAKASCDPDVIRSWDWSRATGVGVYLPSSGLVVADIDGDHKRAAAEALGIRLDRGLVAKSGRADGGYHVYFRRPAGVTAEQWGNPRIDGIEIRANGQQVLPPSRHKNGATYAWLVQDAEIPELPAEVVKARHNGGAHKVDSSRHGHLLGIGMKAARRAIAEEIKQLDTSDGRVFDDSEIRGLAKHGAGYVLADMSGERPRPSTSSRPRPQVTSSLVPTPYGGDEDAHLVPDLVLPPHSWRPVDLIAAAAAPPAPPSIVDVLYQDANHLISGESEALKTWFALAGAAAELAAGRGVLWVDGDDVGRGAVLERLRMFGVPDEAVASRFAYVAPDEPLDADRRSDVLDVVRTRACRLAVLDGFNPLLVLHGFDPDRGSDVEQFYQLVAPIKRAPTAVVLTDNVVKAREARGKWAIGSERKKSKAEVHLGMVSLAPLVRGGTGRARIDVHKDRPGHLTRPSPGVLEVCSTTRPYSWRIHPDASFTDEGEFRPTVLMERVSRHLEFHQAARSRNMIEGDVKGKASGVRLAIDRLVIEGYASEFEGDRGARMVRIDRAFREEADE